MHEKLNAGITKRPSGLAAFFPEEPLRIHPIYSALERQRLLVIETAFTANLLTEEAKSMQKMTVFSFQDTPVVEGKELSIEKFVREKNIRFLVIQPHIRSVDAINRVIDSGVFVILLESSFSVDETTNAEIQQWKEHGIPTVRKDDIAALPTRVMKTMADILEDSIRYPTPHAPRG